MRQYKNQDNHTEHTVRRSTSRGEIQMTMQPDYLFLWLPRLELFYSLTFLQFLPGHKIMVSKIFKFTFPFYVELMMKFKKFNLEGTNYFNINE